MDRGHELTEAELQRLEKRIAEEYAAAARTAAEKYEAWAQRFAEAEAAQRQRLAAGEITQQEFNDWRLRHTLMGQDWRQMRDTLASDLEHTGEIARRIAGEAMPDVYALNANFATYQIEHGGQIDTGFSLYNHDTAELLLREENLPLMPGPSKSKAEKIRANADLQWNKQKIQSAVLQGILLGESPAEVAVRLLGVAKMDANAAIRYARTMTTCAQNAGRYRGYRRAKALGVDLTIEWQATLDHSTREEHRMLHGQRREVDEPFVMRDGTEILWPANEKCGTSTVPQSQIWNCRCTLLAWVKGFEGETVKSSPKMGGMSFEDWQKAKPARAGKTGAKPGKTGAKPGKTGAKPGKTGAKPGKTATAGKTAGTGKAAAAKKAGEDLFKDTKGLSDDYRKALATAVNGTKNEDVKKVFQKFADQLVCKDDKIAGGAYFNASAGGTFFNAAADMKSRWGFPPLANGTHEFGHMIDWLAGGKDRWDYLSNTEIGGKRLEKVIKSDFQAFKKSLGVSKAADVIPVLQAENLPMAARADISDILEKCTGKSYPLGAGHGVGYHKREGVTEKEFFAEVLSAAVVNPESYAQLSRLFPNAVEMVMEMVRSVS